MKKGTITNPENKNNPQLLKEFSFNEITEEQVFTKEFIKYMMNDDFVERLIDQYRERNFNEQENEKISDEEILNSKLHFISFVTETILK